jgi:dihydroflavonol-4-reductase
MSKTNKKILVTGASGFIGSFLVEELLRDGVNVRDLRLLLKPGDSLENLPSKNFDIVWADIRNKKAVKRAMDGVETIFHLAAKTVFEGKTYKDFKDVNVDGTQNLLDAAKGKKIQKFILFSTIAVYGLPAYAGERINCDETWPLKPMEDYGKSKLEAEKRLLKAHRDWGIPYVIIRPTTVYGPRDHQGMIELYRAIKRHYFFNIGDGKNKMDYVFVKDLVKGVRQAQLSKSKADDFILGADKKITSKEVAKCVAKSINEKVPNWYIPKIIAFPISYVVELLSKILQIRPPLFPNRVRILTQNCYFNIDKAKKKLSYHPRTSFEQGAMITGKWFLKNSSRLLN